MIRSATSLRCPDYALAFEQFAFGPFRRDNSKISSISSFFPLLLSLDHLQSPWWCPLDHFLLVFLAITGLLARLVLSSTFNYVVSARDSAPSNSSPYTRSSPIWTYRSLWQIWPLAGRGRLCYSCSIWVEARMLVIFCFLKVESLNI